MVAVTDERDPDSISPAVEGILACIETGLAHLTPEQRRAWETDADPNLLLAEATERPDSATAEESLKHT